MQQLASLWVSPEPLAAAWLCIRLWFTSVLCDHQNIQLSLTAVAWSENTEQLHSLYISLPGSFLSSLTLTRTRIFHHTCLLWCGNKPIFTALHLAIPVLFYLPHVAFTSLKVGQPLVSCFCHVCWGSGRVEVVRDNLVCCLPRFLFCQPSN